MEDQLGIPRFRANDVFGATVWIGNAVRLARLPPLEMLFAVLFGCEASSCETWQQAAPWQGTPLLACIGTLNMLHLVTIGRAQRADAQGILPAPFSGFNGARG